MRCTEEWKASRRVSRIMIAAPARPFLPTSIRRSTGWRLAQRVPVRIELDGVERDELVAGATATVEVLGLAHRSVRMTSQAGHPPRSVMYVGYMQRLEGGRLTGFSDPRRA